VGISIETTGGKFLVKNIPVASVGVVRYEGENSSCFRGEGFMRSIQEQLVNKGLTFKHPKSLLIKGADSIKDIKGSVIDTRLEGNTIYADVTTQDGEIIRQLEKLIESGKPLHSSIGYTGVKSLDKSGEHNGVAYNKEFTAGFVNHLAIGLDIPRDKTATGYITSVVNDAEDGLATYEIEETVEIQNPLINNNNMLEGERSVDAGELNILQKKVEALELSIAESKASNLKKDATILELEKSLSEKTKIVNDGIEVENELAEYKNKDKNQALAKELAAEGLNCEIDISKPYAENIVIAQEGIAKAIEDVKLSKEDLEFVDGVMVDSQDLLTKFRLAMRLATKVINQSLAGSGIGYSKTKQSPSFQDTINELQNTQKQ